MIETPSFRQVMRGYDPAEVDMKVQDLVVGLNQAQNEIERLREQLGVHQGRIVELETASAQVADPSLVDLGERSQRIFQMLDDEVRQIRANSVAEAERLTRLTAQEAAATRQEAEDYALSTRTQGEQDATRRLMEAQAKANEILAAADKAAQVKADEAQAAYDQHRSRIAALANDFEQSMSERREKSELEFAIRMKEQEMALASAEQRQIEIENEAEYYRQAKQTEADSILNDARASARNIVQQAEMSAEQTRREANRDLKAAMARKDAITAQMASLRQILSSSLGVSEDASGDVTPPVKPVDTAIEAALRAADEAAKAGSEPVRPVEEAAKPDDDEPIRPSVEDRPVEVVQTSYVEDTVEFEAVDDVPPVPDEPEEIDLPVVTVPPVPEAPPDDEPQLFGRRKGRAHKPDARNDDDSMSLLDEIIGIAGGR